MSETHITLDRSARVATIDRRIFGSFVEHLGCCVYDGISEPGTPWSWTRSALTNSLAEESDRLRAHARCAENAAN